MNIKIISFLSTLLIHNFLSGGFRAEIRERHEKRDQSWKTSHEQIDWLLETETGKIYVEARDTCNKCFHNIDNLSHKTYRLLHTIENNKEIEINFDNYTSALWDPKQRYYRPDTIKIAQAYNKLLNQLDTLQKEDSNKAIPELIETITLMHQHNCTQEMQENAKTLKKLHQTQQYKKIIPILAEEHYMHSLQRRLERLDQWHSDNPFTLTNDDIAIIYNMPGENETEEECLWSIQAPKKDRDNAKKHAITETIAIVKKINLEKEEHAKAILMHAKETIGLE